LLLMTFDSKELQLFSWEELTINTSNFLEKIMDTPIWIMITKVVQWDLNLYNMSKLKVTEEIKKMKETKKTLSSWSGWEKLKIKAELSLEREITKNELNAIKEMNDIYQKDQDYFSEKKQDFWNFIM
jgi:hypothetical protein